MSDKSPTFAVSCPTCGVERSSDDFDDVAEFAEKHNEHTDHTCEWDRSKLGTEIEIKFGTTWLVTCDECVDEWKFKSKTEAEDWYHDHTLYTNHYANEPENIGKTIDGIENLDKLIQAYSSTGRFERGVPIQVLLADLENHGIEESVATAKIEEMRQRGLVYEPEAGRIRLT